MNLHNGNLEKLKRKYWSIFSIEEFDNSLTLRLLFFVSIFQFSLALKNWVFKPIATIQSELVNETICWPHFQNCYELYVLNYVNSGASHMILYMFLFIVLILAGIFAFKKEWGKAHLLLGILFLWRFVTFLFLTKTIPGNYEYFAQPLAFVLLFARNKLFYGRVFLVFVYFFSAKVKFHESWVVGTYFSSTAHGIPLIPDSLLPLATNLIIVMEIFTSWLLLSNKPRLRIPVLYLWMVFHIYSVTIVGFTYPFYIVPLLLILFGINEKASIKFNFRFGNIAPILGLVFLTAIHLVPHIIEGDMKYTQEGYKYGVGMIDANHQCQTNSVIHFKDGTSRKDFYNSKRGQHRCPTYTFWYQIKSMCRKNPNIQSVEWKFIHSINGGPFYEIVNEQNACDLSYHPFRHNEWINIPKNGTPIAGYPSPNYLLGPDTRPNDPFISDTPRSNPLSSIQADFKQVETPLIYFYWFAWWSVFAYVIFRGIRLALVLLVQKHQ